ncbi:CRISPR-associated protein Cas4 [Colibacter massiliensis]|uniref:CRISPR-associated protein Cas4 n=1 Tax=Colibacter massiliensis TaxID=1852379 RepID=UPI003F8F379C
MAYDEDEYLFISGIQHYNFCKRQWALIHIEQKWEENIKTVEGNIVHDRCHDDTFFEKRNDLLITRGMRVSSHSLGVTGQCDVVEFKKGESGCHLDGYDGVWQPFPVEYKRGKSKQIDADRLQLCCQALCLEEMLAVDIPVGALYYAETRHRENVVFTEELRSTVEKMLAEMRDYFRRGHTPKVRTKAGCRSCSLRDECLPGILKKKDVAAYYDTFLGGGES